MIQKLSEDYSQKRVVGTPQGKRQNEVEEEEDEEKKKNAIKLNYIIRTLLRVLNFTEKKLTQHLTQLPH